MNTFQGQAAFSNIPRWVNRGLRPFHWQQLVVCLPTIPLILVGGSLLRARLAASIAAGAAISVGFGASRALYGRRWGAMAAATVCMAVAAFAGSCAGGRLWILLLFSGATAAACAVLALIDDDLWWVVLQSVIALLVAGAYPGNLTEAAARAGVIFLGGAAQVGVVLVLTTLLQVDPLLPPAAPKPPQAHARPWLAGLRAAVCIVISLYAARALHWSNSYWAPMTAMLVLKPGLRETQVRGVARFSGTILGCVLATLFVDLTHGAPGPLVAALSITAALAFALQKASYVFVTAGITATIVLLISLSTGMVLATAEHRIFATLLGGVVAIAVAFAFPPTQTPVTPA
ncbi:MAG TPA: FUSC family protein [Steroidobacteraceae bacterium]|nr:FUSC family protein [Steroidobacteraceae bacterium]